MSVDNFLNQTIRIEARLAEGVDGRPSSYSDPKKVMAKVESQRKIILNETGERATTSARIYVKDAAVSIGDRITLPDGSQKEVIQVAQIYDGLGAPSHKVVLI